MTTKATIPNGWKHSSVGNIAEQIQYGYTAKSTQEEVGPKFLRITDIQNNMVNWGMVPYCEIDENDKKKYLLNVGDIVFARTGATVGKSFLLKGVIPESIFASYLIRIVLHKKISESFVYHFFQSYDYWLQISEEQAGIGQPNVNGKKLSKIKLPLPPSNEQKRIVYWFSVNWTNPLYC